VKKAEEWGVFHTSVAAEACEFVRDIDFEPSKVAFDAAFSGKDWRLTAGRRCQAAREPACRQTRRGDAPCGKTGTKSP